MTGLQLVESALWAEQAQAQSALSAGDVVGIPAIGPVANRYAALTFVSKQAVCGVAGSPASGVDDFFQLITGGVFTVNCTEDSTISVGTRLQLSTTLGEVEEITLSSNAIFIAVTAKDGSNQCRARFIKAEQN